MNGKTLVSFIWLLVSVRPALAERTTSHIARAEMLKKHSPTPVAFIENAGQIPDPAVRYAFYGSGANIFHTRHGPVLQPFQPQTLHAAAHSSLDEPRQSLARSTHPLTDEDARVAGSCVFSIRFIGANQVEPAGLDRQLTRVHYFLGRDRHNWHTDVAAYSKVVYPRLYNGIDLYTFGDKSCLKYEFHIALEGRHNQIIIAYEGIKGLTVDSEGALHARKCSQAQ
ncbi:MAG: DUF7948 domain-containing protein [Planctomycetota bacterium]|jgi:hypothetical protein